MNTAGRIFAALLFVIAVAAAALNAEPSLYQQKLPAQYQREIPTAVRDWKISVSNGDTEPVRFGPLVLGGTSASATEGIDVLGPPDAVHSEQTYCYYGLGLMLTRPKPRARRIAEVGYYPKPASSMQSNGMYRGFGNLGERIHVLPPDLSPEDKFYRLTQVCFGNPNALSVDDPLVKSCPFTFDNGVRLGDGLDDVVHAFQDYGFQTNRYQVYATTLSGHGIRMHFFRDRLVAIVLSS